MNPTGSTILPSSTGKVGHVRIAAVEFGLEQARRAFEVMKRRTA